MRKIILLILITQLSNLTIFAFKSVNVSNVINEDLLSAVKQNNFQNLEKALQQGGDVNFINSSGHTILQIALDNFDKNYSLKFSKQEKYISITTLLAGAITFLGEALYAQKTSQIPLYIENNNIRFIKNLNEDEKKYFVKSRSIAGLSLALITLAYTLFMKNTNAKFDNSVKILELLVKDPKLNISKKNKELILKKLHS